MSIGYTGRLYGQYPLAIQAGCKPRSLSRLLAVNRHSRADSNKRKPSLLLIYEGHGRLSPLKVCTVSVHQSWRSRLVYTPLPCTLSATQRLLVLGRPRVFCCCAVMSQHAQYVLLWACAESLTKDLSVSVFERLVTSTLVNSKLKQYTRC